MLGILLSVAMLASNAEALPEPKVTITYSLKTSDCLNPPDDCGGYWQKIFMTPLGAGDVEFVCDINDSMDTMVNVTRATPLMVTIEYTADSPGGNIVDGPVELTQTDFGRDFILTTIIGESDAVVTTIINTVLSQKGTGSLSGSTITWDNGMAPYKETVTMSSSDCVGDLCSLSPPAGGWPQSLNATDRAVVLPDFTLFTNSVFGDEFASDDGTPGDPSDDIDRPDEREGVMVKDTWYGVEVVPEPSGEILLLAGVLGLAGLSRLRERGGASALCANLFTSRR